MTLLSDETSPLHRNSHSTLLTREENPHRRTDAVLFPCVAHGKAAVLCVRAGKIGRQRRQAAIGATVFWLTCPSLNNALAHLEQSGVVRVLNRFLTSSSSLAAAHNASHAVFTARVEALLTKEGAETFRPLSHAEEEEGRKPNTDSEGSGSPSSFSSTDASMKENRCPHHYLSASSPSLSSSSPSRSSSAAPFVPSSLWEMYRNQFVSPAEEKNKKYGNSGSSHRTTVKCLHALVAQELCGARNPIGEAICNYVWFLHQLFYPALSSSSSSLLPPSLFSSTPAQKTDVSKKRTHHTHTSDAEEPKEASVVDSTRDPSEGEAKGEGEEKGGAPKQPTQRWQAILMESSALFENFLRASLLLRDFPSSSSSFSTRKESAAKDTDPTLCMYPASGERVMVMLPPSCTASTSSSVVEYHWKVWKDFQGVPVRCDSHGAVDERGKRHDETPPLDLCRVAHEVVVAAKGKDNFSKKRRIN